MIKSSVASVNFGLTGVCDAERTEIWGKDYASRSATVASARDNASRPALPRANHLKGEGDVAGSEHHEAAI